MKTIIITILKVVTYIVLIQIPATLFSQNVLVRDLHKYDADPILQSDLTTHPLIDVQVEFRAMVVSDPRNSGIASITNSGLPGRIHFFVLDVNASDLGQDGMYIQLVADGNNIDKAMEMNIGDIIDVSGKLAFFGNISQFNVIDYTKVSNVQHDSNYSDLISFLKPINVNTSTLNRLLTESGKITWNPESYQNLIHSYVTLSGMEVLSVSDQPTGRPWILLSDGTSKIYTSDMSLRFRNDRGTKYADGFNYRRLNEELDGPYITPAVGSIIDISGFIILNTFDPEGISQSTVESPYKIVPWGDGYVWSDDSFNIQSRQYVHSQNDIKLSISSFSCNGSISDSDGNVYTIVQIGSQCWMSQNLRVSRFNDGTPIPQITLSNSTAWSTNSTGAWSYYDDNVSNNAIFGKLYNYYVVENDKNICPVGWEVPSDSAWTQLLNYLGVDSGRKLKSTSGWRDGGNGNNSSGFNAVPAGRKGVSGTSYSELGQAARFWSSTENNQNNGWIYRLTYDSNDLQRDYNQKGNGFSIRCVYSQPVAVKTTPDVETRTPNNLTSSTVNFRGRIISDGSDSITNSGFCFGTSSDPGQNNNCISTPLNGSNFEFEIPGLLPETQYYVRAFADNSIGRSYGASVGFVTPRFVCGDGYSDIEGKVYTTVQIGDQCWMSQNLRVSRFNDGTYIPEIKLSSPVAWSTNDTGAWSYYDDNPDNNTPYGKLYNFYVVSSNKNICPVGWKVPTDQEWSALSSYLGSNAGQKMKSTSGWRDSGNGTNESGFNVFPAGRKGVSGTAYTELLMAARFWSSTENNINNGWIYRLSYDSNDLQRDYNQMGNGFSIRCMLDPASPVSIEEAKLDVPTTIELQQNYPNPFNPTTQIRFALPESQQVSIQVYDVNGRLVAELLNNVTYSAGNHQVTFDGSGLSSGIYIYTLTTSNGLVQSRKLLLMK